MCSKFHVSCVDVCTAHLSFVTLSFCCFLLRQMFVCVPVLSLCFAFFQFVLFRARNLCLNGSLLSSFQFLAVPWFPHVTIFTCCLGFVSPIWLFRHGAFVSAYPLICLVWFVLSVLFHVSCLLTSLWFYAGYICYYVQYVCPCSFGLLV